MEKYSCEQLLVIQQLKLLKFQGKKNYFHTHAAGFIHLVYFNEIFKDNHNIVRDHFVTDLVNLKKNRPLVAKKHKELLMYINLAQSHQNKNMEIVTRNDTKNFS